MLRLSLIVRALLLVSLSGGLFLDACDSRGQKAVGVVNLNTSEVIEADDRIVDSVMGPLVLSVYLCKALPGVKDNAAPYADVYTIEDGNFRESRYILDGASKSKKQGSLQNICTLRSIKQDQKISI